MSTICKHHVFIRDDYITWFVHLKISTVQRRSSTRIDPKTKRSKSPRGMDLSQYRKIIIYVLTFLAYAWSGYGAGLLSNLRDAVLAAESVFQDLFTNAITVARKIKDIHEVLDAAVEENCVFQCPDGMYIYVCGFIHRVIRLSLHRAPPLVDSDRFGALYSTCTFCTLFLIPLFF